MPPTLDQKERRLIDAIRAYGSCAVAFSGGVDSSVVSKAAQIALGDRAVAVTASSDSLAEGELESASHVAREIGIRHLVIATNELSSPDYVQNGPDRCFHCKSELYHQMQRVLAEHDLAIVINGANLDDLGDYRPGLRAAEDYSVRSPLADCQIGKADVRALARRWQLPVWEKPAAPCLASRLAYGQSVTPERLRKIDQAEQYIRQCGFTSVRVRYHEGDLARVEVAANEVSTLASHAWRTPVAEHLRGLGFRFIAIDMEGFRSGNLNQLVPSESLLPKVQ